MKLFLLRHGDRSSGYGDVPLSSEGNRQAQALCELPTFQSLHHIFASPKIRAQQTVRPLADRLNLPITTDISLDQRKSIEQQSEFTRRVLNCLNFYADTYPGKNILLCSHSDWLQTAILSMPSANPDNAIHSFFSCADYKILSKKNDLWEVL